MATSATDRLRHIRHRIALIRSLWANTGYSEAWADDTRWPAFERHLEIISEASRSIPPDWKAIHASTIEWEKVAGLGNLLRHVYQYVNGPILWAIYENDLEPLDAAIADLLARTEK